MKKTLKFISFLFLLSFFPFQNSLASNQSFSDVSSDREFYASIEFLTKQGILEGYEGGIFNPGDDVNRAEAAKVMTLVNGVDPDPNIYRNCFPDVREEWFARFICYSKDQGWINGYPDGNFLPANAVNHAELTKMVSNSLFNQTFQESEDGFWYTPYLNFARQKNIIWKDSSENWLTKSALREEVAEQFFRAMLVKQENWPAYSEYFRDIYFKNNSLDQLISSDYPCYYNSHFGFFPTFPDYLKSEYGITKLDGRIYDFSETPHFDGYQFCVSDQGNLVFSGAISDRNEEGVVLHQHLLHFNPKGSLLKDQWVSCEDWMLLDRPSLLINGMNLDTVELLHCFYAKDKNHVYYRSDDIFDAQGPTGPQMIQNADPTTFELLTFPYSRDKNKLYFYWHEMEEVDLASFEILPTPGVDPKAPFSYYAKDKNHVYYYGKVIPEADPETFERLSPEGLELGYPRESEFVNYSKDANHIFFGKDILEEADSGTFEIFNIKYSVDSNNVYRYGKKVEDWDGASFEIINDIFVKDNKGVYYRKGDQFHSVKEADPASFELVGASSNYDVFYRDKNRIYLVDHENYIASNKAYVTIENADPASFEVLNRDYVRDKDHFYEIGWEELVLVEYIDLGTFEVLNDYYVKDINGIYSTGERIEGVDLKSFEVVYSWFAKDQFMVYRFNRPYPEIDAASFQKLNDEENPYLSLYKDKNHLYTWRAEIIPTPHLELSTTIIISNKVARDAYGVECNINLEDLELTVCTQN